MIMTKLRTWSTIRFIESLTSLIFWTKLSNRNKTATTLLAFTYDAISETLCVPIATFYIVISLIDSNICTTLSSTNIETELFYFSFLFILPSFLNGLLCSPFSS